MVTALALIAAMAAGCGLVPPSGPTSSGSRSSPPAVPSPSAATTGVPASAAAIEPGVGRLVWLVDRAGNLGVWSTDLAGGDVRTLAADLDEAGNSLREPHPIGEDVVVIRDAARGPQLWLLSQTAPPRLLLDGVETFVVENDETVLAVQDQRATRGIWRVPTSGAAPVALAELPIPDESPELGPFGFALSPDGQTVAAGWVGGPGVVAGPTQGTFGGSGAPLVVADDGRVIATTGRAGEAYLVDGDRLVELAPADSDPLAMPGTASVAWGSVGADGGLVAVEVRDLLAGTSETYPAAGPATNVIELTPDHVVLEATPFDPLTRTVTVIDRHDGRSTTFEASAPAVD